MSKYVDMVELNKQLTELRDFNLQDWKSTMRKAVRDPMVQVMRRARGNIAAVSPGKTPWHYSYLGKQGPILTAGFAARNLRIIVKLGKGRSAGSASAVLGVRQLAFYAIQFFELGTARIPRRPWLVPALEASKDAAVQEVGAAMKKRIEAIARKRAGAGATRNLV